MNPDLMITIAFSLWAVLGWAALGLLVVHSMRSENVENVSRAALSKKDLRNEAPAA